jgi:hypothetical protein
MADALASEARPWMVKAWRDLETARRSATGEPPFFDISVFTVSRRRKSHHGKPFERTHDIEVLVDLACEKDSRFSQLTDAADALTPYATRFRLRRTLRRASRRHAVQQPDRFGSGRHAAA